MQRSEDIIIEGLIIPFCSKTINIRFIRGLNYLKGNNGSGKTLLLDYVSGLRKDTSSTICGNHSIIYINQSIFFSDRLKGADFLKFVNKLDNKGRTVSDFFLFIDKYINETHTIREMLNKQWGMLSGGEKKFLYITILLSLEREWYILDEPFAFVDEEKKKIIWKIIWKKIYEGKGMILTSHEKDTEIENNNINVIEI